MWPHLLLHLPEDILGPCWPHGHIHVPTMPGHLQQETHPKTHWRLPTIYYPTQLRSLSASASVPWLQLCRTSGCGLWYLRWQEAQSHQDLPDVPGVLLWEASQAPLWVSHVQKAQAGGWNRPLGQTDLSAASEGSGIVLSHWPNVYLCAVHGERTQGSWHGICWAGESGRAGRIRFYDATPSYSVVGVCCAV